MLRPPKEERVQQVLMEPPPILADYTREVRLASGLRLHCYEAGGGPATPLVLIHGLGDEADSWRHVLPHLARKRRVIALDLPGFGRSDKPRRAYTTAFFARTLVELLAELGIERAMLAGSSMGAMVAQRLALARPDLVERLVLIDGALPIVPIRPQGMLLRFLTPGLGELTYNSLRRSQDQAYESLRPYYFDLDGLSDEDRDFLRRRVWARVWNDGQRDAFLSALRWLAIDSTSRVDSWRARLATMTTPTLLVWGDSDQIQPAALGEAMADLLPAARLTLLAGCGHLPQQERPAALIAALISFAESAPDRPGGR